MKFGSNLARMLGKASPIARLRLHAPWRVVAALVAAALVAGGFLLHAFGTGGGPAPAADAAAAAAGATSGNPSVQLHVAGNQLVNASGQRVVLHGVDRSGTEFMCVQKGGIFDGPDSVASIQ